MKGAPVLLVLVVVVVDLVEKLVLNPVFEELVLLGHGVAAGGHDGCAYVEGAIRLPRVGRVKLHCKFFGSAEHTPFRVIIAVVMNPDDEGRLRGRLGSGLGGCRGRSADGTGHGLNLVLVLQGGGMSMERPP